MANVQAKVELTGSLSHTARGRTFFRGKPQVITNPGDIEYYKREPGYTVTVTGDKPAKKGAKSLPPSTKKSAPPPPVDDDEEEEEDDDEDESDGDDEDDDSDEDDDTDVGDGEVEQAEASTGKPAHYKKKDLEAMTKQQLVTVALEEFNTKLDPNDNKPTMIAKVLKAQIAKLKD